LLLADLEIGQQIGPIEKLLDIGHNYPICFAATALPDLVAKPAFLIQKGLAPHVKVLDAHSLVVFQERKGFVSRAVVEDKILVDDLVVVPEKVREHPRIVPGKAIQMDAKSGWHCRFLFAGEAVTNPRQG
jgi:hypothetical protein